MPIHENPIFTLATEYNGCFGASASAQGTIIRVFDCTSLEKLYELKKGTSPAQISSISFSPQQNYLVVTSSKSTVHLWNLKKNRA